MAFLKAVLKRIFIIYWDK